MRRQLFKLAALPKHQQRKALLILLREAGMSAKLTMYAHAGEATWAIDIRFHAMRQPTEKTDIAFMLRQIARINCPSNSSAVRSTRSACRTST